MARKMMRMKSKSKKMRKMAKKAMKSRRMKKRISKIAKGKMARSVVFRGNKEKTSGGLKKNDLIRNKRGKIVSRKQSMAGKKRGKAIARWGAATKRARQALGIKGFCPVGGKTAAGQRLLKKVRSFLK